MRANELRLGNLVYDTEGKENIITTEALTYIQKHEGTLCQSSPITLTEEWLLKFGFKETEEGVGFHAPYFNKSVNADCLDVLFLRPFFMGGFIWGFNTAQDSYLEIGQPKAIEYVHSLQNFWFALTGEELEISNK